MRSLCTTHHVCAHMPDSRGVGLNGVRDVALSLSFIGVPSIDQSYAALQHPL